MYLETKRMILRAFCPEDADDLHEILGDAETMAHCEPAYDLEKTRRFLAEFCIKKQGALAAVRKDSGKVIGYILFQALEDGVYEIGWIFYKGCWRQGYAYESCSQVIAHAFRTLNVRKVVAETVDREKSVPLMEKLGMTFEGVREGLFVYGISRDDPKGPGASGKIEVAKLSSAYRARTLTGGDLPLIHGLCLENTQFYQYCGTPLSAESIRRDMALTPPGKSLTDKYYVGFFDGEALVAVMDLIDGYPDEATAYIGFFMLAKDRQGRGLGSRLITEVCGYLKSKEFRRIQLGIDKDNPQSNHFWKKNGFIALAEVPREGGILLRAQRTL